METAFMVFGLGFFLYVIWLVQNAEERRYQRKMAELREFGTMTPDPERNSKRK